MDKSINCKCCLTRSRKGTAKPCEVRFSEVLEIWRYTCCIATKEFEPDDLGVLSIKDFLQGIRQDFSALRMEFDQRKA